MASSSAFLALEFGVPGRELAELETLVVSLHMTV
jgi:hypothetical protein